MNQTPIPKILEILVDGTVQGSLHLNVNGKIKIIKIKLDKIENKLTRKNLLHANTDYSSLGYEGYKTILEKGLQSDLYNNKVEVKEKQLPDKLVKLYEKFLIKKEKSNYHTHSK